MNKKFARLITLFNFLTIKYYQMNFFKPMLKYFIYGKKALLFLMLMIFLTGIYNSADAQNSNVISGKVQDNTGAAISGVSVILKGSKTGVTTDDTGQFSRPQRFDLLE
jgi:hypothetical protein